LFFFPFFLPATFGKKKSDKIIRSESADRCGLDIVTFKIGKTCSWEEVDPRYYPWNLVYDHSTKFTGHGVKALEFCSLLSFSVLILVSTDPFFGVADAASMLLKPRLLRPQPAWDDDGR
jgi:hypothetical protein